MATTTAPLRSLLADTQVRANVRARILANVTMDDTSVRDSVSRALAEALLIAREQGLSERGMEAMGLIYLQEGLRLDAEAHERVAARKVA